MASSSKVLFILKRREDYNAKLHAHIGLSTGLYNSASFVHKMLLNLGIDSNLVVVADNNDIDREVTLYKPTHVIIEALWVVPTKFDILSKLHPTVTWIIRLHSDLPFLAGEGVAMDWIADYARHKNVIISANAPRMLEETRFYISSLFGLDRSKTLEKVIYLPNYYPQEFFKKSLDKTKPYIDIGCFGAVRPLKNHLIQAFAALNFADNIGKQLHFHINAGRIEMKGEPVLNNLRGLFEQFADKGHQLISHQWCPREDFLQICRSIDIGLQVSFSETFNIVGADLVTQGVPLVASNEIPWANKLFTCDPTSSSSVYNGIWMAYTFPSINLWCHSRGLNNYVEQTKKHWLRYFK